MKKSAITTGAEIRAARKRLGLTQTELAEKLSTTMNTIARWERGVCSIAHPEAIRLALERLEQTEGKIP